MFDRSKTLRGCQGLDCMVDLQLPMHQCLSPLALWVRTPLRRDVLDTTLYDKICQWLATDQWFSLGTPVSSTNKTYCHDITEILLKVALTTINQPTNQSIVIQVDISCLSAKSKDWLVQSLNNVFK